MATTREKFIEKCEVIVRAKPKYALGRETTKECDCIGMVKYGLHQNGVSFSTSGTNWSFRHHVTDVREIRGVSDLRAGDVVFKVRNPGEGSYALPARYRKGGADYNGDLTDYCHIGVVKSVSPLRIIHMTSPTAKTDTAIGRWKWAAALKSAYISDAGSTQEEDRTDDRKQDEQKGQAPEHAPSPGESATVQAESGRWVKMRKEPSTSCRMYDEVPVGAKVTVEEFGYDWCRISYGKRKGWYMMTKFLNVG